MPKRQFIYLVTALTLLISPAAFSQAGSTTASTNSLMFKGGPAHTGYSKENLTFPLKLAWKYTSGITADNPSSPAVSDGIAYFCSGSRLYAVNSATGELKWRYPDETPLNTVIKSSPAVGDDLVYFGAGDGKIYAITKDTGTLAWNFATNGMVNSSPTLVDGVLFVGSADAHLYALDARTGQSKWPGSFRTRDDISGAPAISDGLVYFASDDMNLYAANTTTGGTRWAIRAGNAPRNSSPVVSDTSVYLATDAGLKSFQSQSGSNAWTARVPADITTTPAVANGAIYFACSDGKLYALTSSGRWKWSKPADIGAPAYGSPIVVGDTVIIGGNKGVLMAVDAETGKIKWKYGVMPSLTDTTTYTADDNQTSGRTGMMGRSPMSSRSQSSTSGQFEYVNVAAAPVVSNGTLYALADDGTLYAFRSDVPDNTSPQVTTVYPPVGTVMNGTPPVDIQAVVADPGSGIDASSITMALDGAKLEHKFNPETGVIWYKTPRTQPIVPLADGRHIVTLTLTDWAGNTTVKDWNFIVDNRILPVQQTDTDTNKNGMPGGMPGMGGPGGPPRF